MTSRSYFKYQHHKDRESKGFFTTKTSSKKSALVKYIIRIGIILLFITTLYFLFISPVFAIKNIQISLSSPYPDLQVPKVTNQDIQAVTQTYLHESIFFLLKKNNFFLFNEKELKKTLEKRFPINEIEIKKIDFHTIEITIKEQSVAAIWFNLDAHYYIDENGFIIDKANFEPYFIHVTDEDIQQVFQERNINLPESTLEIEEMSSEPVDESNLEIIEKAIPESIDIEQLKKEKELEELLIQRKERQEAYINYALLIESGGQPNEGMPFFAKEQFIFPIVYDESRSVVHMGDQVLNKEMVQFLKTLHKHMTEYVNSEVLIYSTEEPLHPRLNAYIKNGYWIYFLTTEELVKQLNNVALILEQKINYPQELEYIDVRFWDKVYFKYKNSLQ